MRLHVAIIKLEKVFSVTTFIVMGGLVGDQTNTTILGIPIDRF